VAEQTAPTRPRRPRFNHVAMSLPADALDERGRQEIVGFYHEVFGWEELPTMTEDRRRLVMMAYEYTQFVFLIADDSPMQAPRLDHFGMGVDTEDELDEFLRRARGYQSRDSRVDLIDKHTDDYGPVAVTSFYVGYLLPMMVEVQHFSFKPTS
jgi:hypothetical protein